MAEPLAALLAAHLLGDFSFRWPVLLVVFLTHLGVDAANAWQWSSLHESTGWVGMPKLFPIQFTRPFAKSRQRRRANMMFDPLCVHCRDFSRYAERH